MAKRVKRSSKIRDGMIVAYTAIGVSFLLAIAYASLSITGYASNNEFLGESNKTGLLFFLIGLWGVFLLKMKA